MEYGSPVSVCLLIAARMKNPLKDVREILYLYRQMSVL